MSQLRLAFQHFKGGKGVGFQFSYRNFSDRLEAANFSP
jgi:hypothetical protein